MIDFRRLVKAGVHFGHQTSRWCPKMAFYIWGFKNKVHLIDVSKTAFQLEKAAQFLELVAAEGKPILWIGTKKAAQKVIKDQATTLKMPYVNHRWIGGTLSNHAQVKKSLTRLLHYEDILLKSKEVSYYTKKELNTFQKIVNRLDRGVGGIRNLTWPIGAVVIVDVTKEQSAVREAVSVGIPIVAIVDTNADPSLIDYVIPANDDSPQSIGVIIDYLGAAVLKGKEAAKKVAAEKQKEERAASAVKDTEEPKQVQKTAKPVATPKQVPQKTTVKKTEKKVATPVVKAKKTVAKKVEKLVSDKSKDEAK